MHFDYMARVVVDDSIDIDDIGNCCVQANNDRGQTFYLLIKTKLGWTEIVEYGPIEIDKVELPYKVYYSYVKQEYNERKIASRIDKFLNDSSAGITQAMLIDEDEARIHIRSMVEYV